MTLTGLECSLLAGIFGIVGVVAGTCYSNFSNRDKCSKCGIDDLRRDIRVQSFTIRHLAQKQGVTTDELLEIESKAQRL